jgi:hypothetical protein
MQLIISIPKNWEYPKAITNCKSASCNYLTANCELRIANWYELFHYHEEQIQQLSPEELQAQIIAKIEEHQQQIKVLQQQLLAIAGGASDG